MNIAIGLCHVELENIRVVYWSHRSLRGHLDLFFSNVIWSLRVSRHMTTLYTCRLETLILYFIKFAGSCFHIHLFSTHFTGNIIDHFYHGLLYCTNNNKTNDPKKCQQKVGLPWQNVYITKTFTLNETVPEREPKYIQWVCFPKFNEIRVIQQRYTAFK